MTSNCDFVSHWNAFDLAKTLAATYYVNIATSLFDNKSADTDELSKNRNVTGFHQYHTFSSAG